MTVEPGYPVTLVHPHYQKAKIAVGTEPAVAERFPAVMVNGADSEAQYRAMGYLRYGEPQQQVDYNEYPKMMRHPEHAAGIPERTEAQFETDPNDGRTRRIVGTFKIPAVPERMPDVLVQDREEEEVWLSKGYEPAGSYDPVEMNKLMDESQREEEYTFSEYPKWENGKLVLRDPNEPEAPEPDPTYPRYEGGTVIPDPRFPEEPDPTLYPMWVHGQIANNPKEEFEIRHKHKLAEEEASVEQAEDELQAELPLVTPDPKPRRFRTPVSSASL